jgi:hypothetical protein
MWTFEHWRSDYICQWYKSRRIAFIILSNTNKSQMNQIDHMSIRTNQSSFLGNETFDYCTTCRCTLSACCRSTYPTARYEISSKWSWVFSRFLSRIVFVFSAWLQCTKWHRKTYSSTQRVLVSICLLNCCVFLFRYVVYFVVALLNVAVYVLAIVLSRSMDIVLLPHNMNVSLVCYQIQSVK